MIPFFSQVYRHMPAVLFAAVATCAAWAAGEQPVAPWKGEVPVNGLPYIPLESMRSFYKLSPLPAAPGGKEIVVGNSGINLVFQRQSSEARIAGYRFRLAHPTAEDARGDILISKTDAVKLLDPLLRPTYISPRRVVRSVVVDPGHGGHDVGIVANGVREADLSLLIARKLKDILAQRGLGVILTREQNHAVSDRQRVDAIARADAPVFISLHINNGRSDTKGIETYTLQPAETAVAPLPGNGTDEANAALAFCLHTSLVAATGAEDGGCRRARFSLLSSATCPAAMVLVGYASHADEAAALNTDDYQDKLALALADGVSTFAKALNPDAKVPVSVAPVDTTPPTPYKAEAPAPKKATPAKRTPAPKTTRSKTKKK